MLLVGRRLVFPERIMIFFGFWKVKVLLQCIDTSMQGQEADNIRQDFHASRDQIEFRCQPLQILLGDRDVLRPRRRHAK